MMRILILLSLFPVASLSLGQDGPLLLSGTVMSSSPESVVSQAHVRLVGEDGFGVTTDHEGRFEMLLDQKWSTGFELVVSHLGFETRTVSYSAQEIQQKMDEKSFVVEILLQRGAVMIPPIDIQSDRLPEIVYGNERHSIADYELLEKGILLLTYEKRLKKAGRLYLVNQNMEHIDSLVLPERWQPQELKRDYSDRVYLQCGTGLYQITYDNGLDYQKIDAQAFREQVEPVIDTIAQRVYFSTWVEQFPAFDYYGFDRTDSSFQRLRMIADEFMLELCRAEYRYLTNRDKLKLWRMELETGIEKEVLACMASFEDGLYYDPIFAPMFIHQDTMYIFDHYNNMLFIHDSDEVPIDSMTIDYHSPGKVMGNHFTEKLFMDDSSGRFFALFQRPGGRCELKEIDKRSGEVLETIALVYDYPEEVQIEEGMVYYLYRPFESAQKKYLYKERM